MKRIRIGCRVKVCDGAGCASREEGIVIPNSQVPTNGRGIPQINDGSYHPIRPKIEVAIRRDNGTMFMMFKNYLTIIE